MTKLTGNALHVLGLSPAVSLEEFEEMWVLNQVGNKEEAYIEVAYGVARKQMLNGAKLTFKMLKERYAKYVEFAQARNPDPKFTSTIANWMRKGKYNEEFNIPHNPSLNRVIKPMPK